MKIDRERLEKLFLDKCQKFPCKKCPEFNKGYSCRARFIASILEQNPDLITGLLQTEQIPLPVKTSWVLKPEFQQFCNDYHISMGFELETEPLQHKEYYNVKTEPDYSQIPVGAVVKIECADYFYYGVVKENDRNKIYIGYTLCADVIDRSKNNLFFNYSAIKSLTIMEMPEAAK